jgi:hypothetical protein
MGKPNVDMECVMNGAASGELAARLLANGLDHRAFRLWVGEDGNSYREYRMPNGEEKVIRLTNNVALLKKDEWVEIERAVMAAYRPRLRLVSDLEANGLVHTLTNGLGTTDFQSQTQSALTEASVGITGLEETDNDKLQYDLTHLPIPFVFKSFQIPIVMLHASRRFGEGLDTAQASEAGLRLGERAEEMVAGTTAPFSFGGGTLYGLTNHPNRVTVALTYNWRTGTGENILTDLISMITAANAVRCFGPFSLYVSSDIGLHLEEDFKAASDKTIRYRMLEVENITTVLTADYLPAGTVLLVQMTPNSVRLIKGLDPTTLQWETHGGWLLHFKVVLKMALEIRSDFYGRCGVIHGTSA